MQSAFGTADVGKLVSEYTRSVSSKECAEGEFDETFKTTVEAGLKVLQSEGDFQASSLCTAPPLGFRAGRGPQGRIQATAQVSRQGWSH